MAHTGRLYDGWLLYPPDPADYEAGLTDVRSAATEAGRAPEAITRHLGSQLDQLELIAELIHAPR